MLLYDNNTACPIELQIPSSKMLRCDICQQFNDHVAAHYLNRNKPISAKRGKQDGCNPACENKVCCVHRKGNYIVGNPGSLKKINTRDLKELKLNLAISRTTALNDGRKLHNPKKDA